MDLKDMHFLFGTDFDIDECIELPPSRTKYSSCGKSRYSLIRTTHIDLDYSGVVLSLILRRRHQQWFRDRTNSQINPGMVQENPLAVRTVTFAILSSE